MKRTWLQSALLAGPIVLRDADGFILMTRGGAMIGVERWELVQAREDGYKIIDANSTPVDLGEVAS